MPHHAASSVAVRSGCLDRRLHRSVDRPELVVLGDAFDNSSRFVAEHDEVAQEIQEALRLERSPDENLELGKIR